jgi:hypothetical protein
MKRILAALPLLLAACSSESALEPKSGAWNYDGSKLEMSTCGDNPPTDASGKFTLTVTSDGKFTVTDESFNNPFECTYESDTDAFSCPKRLAETNKPIDSIDATLSYNVSITGTIDSELELSGTQTVELTCEGTGCALAVPTVVPALPCNYSYSFTASASA